MAVGARKGAHRPRSHTRRGVYHRVTADQRFRTRCRAVRKRFVVGRVGTDGGAGAAEPISRRNAAMTVSSSPLPRRGASGSGAFSTGVDGFLNGDSVGGTASRPGESTRGASSGGGAGASADSTGDSPSLLRRAALISLREDDNCAASASSAGRLTMRRQNRRGGADSVK